jgi:hypothetical protein
MPTPPIADHGLSKSRCPTPPDRPSPRRSEWRCTRCAKLLGVIRPGGRVHLRFGRSHEYIVGYPVVATCRGCGTLNSAKDAIG